MITPTKGISSQRALLTIGAQISMILTEPMTVSQAWGSLKVWRVQHSNDEVLPYSWFVLALDLLYALGTVHYNEGLLYRKRGN